MLTKAEVIYLARNTIPNNDFSCTVSCYFTAPCTKVFQLLLGEVNDCNDWRVRDTVLHAQQQLLKCVEYCSQ